MAKLSAHGGPLARARNTQTGTEISLQANGKLLAKSKGGTWKETRRHIKPDVAPIEWVRVYAAREGWEAHLKPLGVSRSHDPIYTQAQYERRKRSRDKARSKRKVTQTAREAHRRELEDDSGVPDGIEAAAAWELHRYATGRYMFCRRCRSVLDARHSVSVSLGKLHHVLCARCYDKLADRPLVPIESIPLVDIYDGRRASGTARMVSGMLR